MTGLLTSYLQQLPTLTPEMAIAWPLDFAQIDSITVTGFGLAADQASVNTGWSFEYAPVGATNSELRAMFVGSLRSKTESDGSRSLVLENSNFAAMMLPEFEVTDFPKLPGWWPQCRFLLYDQLDWTHVRTAITALVRDLSPILRQQLEVEPALVNAADDQVTRWLLGEPHNGQPLDFALPVIPGDILGSGENAGAGRRRARVRAKENLDDLFFLNLGFYAHAFAQWTFLDGAAIPDTNLRDSLLSHDLPLVANGVVKRVSGTPGPGGFSTVQAAVQDALAGDVVLIADAGPYQAPAVIDIDKPLSIIGATALDALATPTPALSVVRGYRPPQDPRTTPNWKDDAHGAFRIRGVNRGMVALANLRIENGADRQGGGVYVDEVHRVWIHNCVFSGNVAYAGGWLFEGFGGAVCTRHAGILIDKCLFANNNANARGGAVGIFGYGWPIVQDCRFENNRAAIQNVINSDKPFLPRPDGGALGMQMATPNAEERFASIASVADQFEGKTQDQAEDRALELVINGVLTMDDLTLLVKLGAGLGVGGYWDVAKLKESHQSQVFIRGNRFTGNIAGDDGGAIYATGLVRARCENNIITGNAAGANGGGLRISTACDFVVEGGQILDNDSNRDMLGYRCEFDRKPDPPATPGWRFKWITLAGGGIASRTSNLRLVNVLISGNRAHRFAGGGVFFTSTDDGALPIAVTDMRTDWNMIRDILTRDPETEEPRKSFAAFTLKIEGGTISGNSCGWCGGSASHPPPQNSRGRCSSPPPTDSAAREVQHAKGGGIYALRYAEDEDDSDTFFPPLIVSIAAGASLTGNTAAFSATATELFIADLTAPTPPNNNPVRDTGSLSLSPTGALQNPFLYESSTP